MLSGKFKSENILQKIENAGFEAYFIGGCVRDLIMGRQCDDIDITTNATPSEVLEIFSDWQTYETGIKHGTVTIISNGSSAEVTTFRKETVYTDNRRPDNVEFCKNIIDDLSRRDFTINAIAFNPQSGFTDFFDGFGDISRKIIKCIGNAEERFNEDSLRILRALRFSSVFGFEIEKDTSTAIHKCKNLLVNISAERIASELSKMLCGNNIKTVLLEYYDVFETILPELSGMKGFDQHNFHHKYDILEHTAVVIENIKPQAHMRLAALFHDCGKPDCFTIDESGVGHFYSHASISAEKALSALKRLKLDNNTIDKVVKLVKIHDSPIDESEKIVKRKLNKYGERTLRDLIELQRADTMGLADEFKVRLAHFEKIEKIIDKVIDDNQCFSVKGLSVNGYDVMNIGYNGKIVGEILDFLVNAVIDKKVDNKKTNLINYIKRNFPAKD